MKSIATTVAAFTVLLTTIAQLHADPVEIKVDFDQPVVLAGDSRKIHVKVGLTAHKVANKANRAPINLAIVLDRSGSMRGDKLARAKEGAIEAVNRLDARDFVSVVVYDTTIRTIVPSQAAAEKEAIIRQIQSISAGSSTALFGGVSQGAAELRKRFNKDLVNRVILLSDGIANVGPNSPDDLGRLGTALIKEGISVTTIGLGLDYNEDLMTRLSQKSDGNTFFVENSADLPRIFAAELGDVLNIVARQVIIEIQCLDGAKPGRILGREGRIHSQKVEIYLNQLYGGQEKYALLEIEVPKGAAGTTREIVKVSCRYQDATSDKQYASTHSASIAYANDEEKVTRSMSEHVVTALVINTRAIARDRAIELVDAGKNDQAQQVIDLNNAQLKGYREKSSYNEWNNLLFIDGHVEGNVRVNREIKENDGLSNASRKSIRTENNQDLYQQSTR